MGTITENVSDDLWIEWAQTWPHTGPAELSKPPDTGRQQPPLQQESEPLNCPRCGSTNTKFCYYNNYNRSQPRYLCKSCKRYWTKGGTLRNVPVGGGRRENKRPRTSSAATAAPSTAQPRRDITLINNIVTSDQQNMSDILYQALIRSSPPSLNRTMADMNASTTQNPNTGSVIDPISYQPMNDRIDNYGGNLDEYTAPWPIFDINYWNWNDVDGSQKEPAVFRMSLD